MGKEEFKKKKGALLLTNKLGKFERLNQEEMKILINRSVEGLAPVTLEQKRKKLILQVEVTSWYPLTAYMNAPMDADTTLFFIWEALHIAYECERHGLRSDNLCWDPSKVFVNESGVLTMVYWPVTSLERSDFNSLSFFYSFCGILNNSGIDPDIANKYYAYFYQRSNFDLNAFYYVVQDMLAHWRMVKMRKKKKEIVQQPINDFRPDKSEHLFSGWLEKQGSLDKILLEQDETTLGRDRSQCTVEISGYDGVSRRHAVIVNRNDKFYVMDLGSRNGTYLQGMRLQPGQRVQLHDGDHIRLGNAVFLFHELKLDKTISIHQIQRR